MVIHPSPENPPVTPGRRRSLGWAIVPLGLMGWLTLWVFSAPAAHAGALYRCVGQQGEPVYSSHSAGYQGCHRISGVITDPSPRGIHRSPIAAASAQLPLARVHEGEGLPREESPAAPFGSPVRNSFADVKGSVMIAGAGRVTGDRGGSSHGGELSGPGPGPGPVPATPPRILRGAVYRIAHADGSMEYTNVGTGPSSKGRTVTRLFDYIATCAACDLHSSVRWGSVALHLGDYAGSVAAASTEYGLDPAFVRAIIHAESAFNPQALSNKGAQGLMQLMPGTARDMGVTQPFDPDQNIHGGSRYLALLMQTFHGDVRLASAAYNAGAGAVQRYGGVPPYAETTLYVKRVGTLLERYQAAEHMGVAATR